MIDVHAHYLPGFYREALLAHGHAQPDGFPIIPEWSAGEHVAIMDRLGIATSVLSVSSPGVHLADGAPTAELTRAVNDAGRRAVIDHPGRFGLFAALPLPDVDAALAEIEYCARELAVNGFGLLTNVGGRYLGDAAFEPVFAALDRRGARLFIHPTSAPCWEHTSLGRPRPMIEFFFDTTRAVVDLVLNGIVSRYPGIVWIIPHAGATLPMLADRVALFGPLLGSSADVLADLGRLHYDLAGAPVPRQLDALLTLAPREHLHYGSDYPFTPEFAVTAARQWLAGVDGLLEALRGNTATLFPELGAGR